MPDDVEFTDNLIGCTVLDATGSALGPLTALYADADTGRTVFGGIAMIRRGRRRTVFAPLHGAYVAGRTITLRCGGLLVRRAPNVRAGRGLPADAEPDLYTHYDMTYAPSATASRRLRPATQ